MINHNSKAIEEIRKSRKHAARMLEEIEEKIEYHNNQAIYMIGEKEKQEKLVSDFDYILFVLENEIESEESEDQKIEDPFGDIKAVESEAETEEDESGDEENVRN